MEKRVGDIVVGTAQADGKSYVCLLVETDFTTTNRGTGQLETYDVGVCLTGQYLGNKIRLDYLRVVLTSSEVIKIIETHGFDLHTPPELPDDRLPEAERVKRENQKLLKRLEALEAKLAAK